MTIEEVIVEFVKNLPAWLRYPVTALCFWPAALKTRLIYWIWPGFRQLWNRVPGTLVLVGSVPLWESDVGELVRNEGVRCVINLCREWVWHEALYESLGVKAVWLPTVDFDPPSLEDTLRGVEAIATTTARGESTYVHCKAGRGRSVCIVLAYSATPACTVVLDERCGNETSLPTCVANTTSATVLSSSIAGLGSLSGRVYVLLYSMSPILETHTQRGDLASSVYGAVLSAPPNDDGTGVVGKEWRAGLRSLSGEPLYF